MNGSVVNITEQLIKKNIKPSYARVKILEYILNEKSHPNVDEIYSKLVKEIPTLSKTTVYNTLSLFVEYGIARALNIEDNEIRYDGTMADHGHFKCEVCGKVYDFSIDIDKFVSENLAQFKVNEKNVYFKGTCHNCIKLKITKEM